MKPLIYYDISNVRKCIFQNTGILERSQVHDIVITLTDSYNFRQFQKYSLLQCCHY
jgi:hypothetical protein